MTKSIHTVYNGIKDLYINYVFEKRITDDKYIIRYAFKYCIVEIIITKDCLYKPYNMVQLIALKSDKSIDNLNEIETIIYYSDTESIDDKTNIKELSNLLDKCFNYYPNNN